MSMVESRPVAVWRHRFSGTSPITSASSHFGGSLPRSSIQVSTKTCCVRPSSETPQPPKTTAFPLATVIEWPERGEGTSPFVVTCCHDTSPSFFACAILASKGGGGNCEGWVRAAEEHQQETTQAHSVVHQR